MSNDKVLLIDALNFFHRSNIFFKPKSSSVGWSEGNLSEQPDIQPDFTCVYLFFRNLRALIERLTPTKVFFCLEGKNSFRKAIYPEYKANRIVKTGSAQFQAKEKLLKQADIAFDLLHYLPITKVFADTFEADDVINTLAHNLKDEEVIIVSNDRDLIQILQTELKQVKLYNHKDFVEAPSYHFLTFKCFGDKSDNVPHLASEKRAIAYATEPKKLLEFLSSEENRANYSLNKQLVELKMIPDDQLQVVQPEVNYEHLRTEFTRMDFKSILEEKYWDRFVKTFQTLN